MLKMLLGVTLATNEMLAHNTAEFIYMVNFIVTHYSLSDLCKACPQPHAQAFYSNRIRIAFNYHIDQRRKERAP